MGESYKHNVEQKKPEREYVFFLIHLYKVLNEAKRTYGVRREESRESAWERA